MNDKISIQTCLGTITATVLDDPEYPGIDIRLERGGKEILLTWVESIELEEHDEYGKLAIHTYGDCQQDEPTENYYISPEELDEYLGC